MCLTMCEYGTVYICISTYNVTMPIIYNAISLHKHCGPENNLWRRFCATIVGIGVTAAVVATVLLVVGSVLSTQSG